MKYRELMLVSFASLVFFRILKTRRTPEKEQKFVQPNKSATILLKEKEIREYAALRSVAYIAIQKKIYYAKDGNAQPVLWSHNMMETMAALPAEEYFQLNRGIIVHRSIIACAEADVLKHKLMVKLHSPFNKEVNLPASKILAFKVWWSRTKFNQD